MLWSVVVWRKHVRAILIKSQSEKTGFRVTDFAWNMVNICHQRQTEVFIIINLLRDLMREL